MNKEKAAQEIIGSPQGQFLPAYQPSPPYQPPNEQKSLKRSYEEMSGVYMPAYHQGNMMHPCMPPNNRIFYRQPYSAPHSLHIFPGPIHMQNHPGLLSPQQSHFQQLQLHLQNKQQVMVQEPVFPKFPPQNFDIPDISSSNSVYGDFSYGSQLSPSSVNGTPSSRQSSYAYISVPHTEQQSTNADQQQQQQQQQQQTEQQLHPNNNSSRPPLTPQFPQRWPLPPSAGSADSSSPVSQSEETSASFDANIPYLNQQQSQPPPPPLPPQPQQQNMKINGFEPASNIAKPALPAKKTRSPKKRKRKDPNEPQKPVSAYSLFFRNAQAAIKSQNPNATFGDVSKIVASMWDGLDDDIKNYYKRQMEMAKKEYLKQLAIYRSSLATKETQGTATSNEAALSQESNSEDKNTEEISSSSISQDQNVSTTTNCLPPTQQEPEQQAAQPQQHSPAQMSPVNQQIQQMQQQQPLMMPKNYMPREMVQSPGRYMMINHHQQYPPQQHFNQQMSYIQSIPHHHNMVQSNHDEQHMIMRNVMPNYNQMPRLDEVLSPTQGAYNGFPYLGDSYDFASMENFTSSNRSIDACPDLDDTLKIT